MYLVKHFIRKQNDNLPCFQSRKAENSYGNILLIKEELSNFNKYNFTE
jgi:hypothetical protein